MIDQFTNLLTFNNYSQTSIATYVPRLKELMNFINKKTGRELIKNGDKITGQNINLLIEHSKDFNDGLISINNKLKTMTMIKSIIKNAAIKDYKIAGLEILNKNFKKVKTVRDDNINKNLKSMKYETEEYKNLTRAFFTPAIQNKLTTIECFIISLYLITPPLRNNYYNVIYYKNEDDFNDDERFQVKIWKNKMIVNKEILKVPVDENIETILTPYQEKLLSDENIPNGAEIIDSNKNTFAGTIKKISMRAFGKNFGINDYRHMFISGLNINDYSNEQLKKIALSLNQLSLETLLTYRKFK